MANKNLTVFQRLGQILGPDTATKQQIKQTQKYNIGKGELLKTDNKAEYEQAKLQAQQSKYLGQVWKKVESGLFQQSMNYETTRIGSYSDFEAMEFYPTIAAALDVMMEESTTLNDKGKMLNVYSDSKRVKSILEDLFFNRLDLHTSLPMFTRNTCKYGDNFVYMNIDEKHGILGAKQMPNYEMERREAGLFDMISGRELAHSEEQTAGDKVKFFWRGRDIEFNSWQIAHFRLLGDDRRLPYGTSVLEKARRIWKQLILSEDSMLVYRVTRAPERRVYKIFVGNIDDADVEQYVNQIADRFKRMPITDPATGQIDLRYNMMSNDQDFFIPVRTEDAPNPIDVLPGAQNLDQIADIEYLQRNLFTALRVPKPFLGFEEAAGDGKNLAIQDIRFARTINRIQQSMIQELNKIAIIHLYILGFEDDLDNFTLTLNNPSTQGEMLKVEQTQLKIQLFQSATQDLGNGFAAMSMTRAHREILGWSDDEIKQDLLEQRMEKAAAAEIANTANVIKHTGMFDNVDRVYGDFAAALKGGVGPGGAEEGEAGGGSAGGGGFGGGSMGGEDLDFGDETGGEEDMGGEAGTEAGGEDMGAAPEGSETPESGAEETPEPSDAQNVAERVYKMGELLKEEKHILSKKLESRKAKYQDIYFKRLMESMRPNEEVIDERIKLYDKNVKVNEEISNMIKGIDKILGE
jgi:Bacteriophage T4-like portal protein (Gp20)